MAELISRRSQRSKDLFIRALLRLMHEKPLDEISIKEIVAEASLTRQTFYRHFTSKDDVLKTCLDQMYKECFSMIDSKHPKHLVEVLRAYFDYWLHYQKGIQILYQQNAQWVVNDIVLVYEKGLKPYVEPYFNPDLGPNTEYLWTYLFGGLVQMKSKWFENHCRVSTQEMATMVYEFWTGDVFTD
ncbi:TetR/AcrR family transcriptional regulator [Streptococcus sp. zg-JUN1979]|uniref:TetR/AcrR family transcriptional regulator n=1 Tax=Streptococcus sp. zg-JUN1979 TaxID=3391450 RepID=UPI0039A75C36